MRFPLYFFLKFFIKNKPAPNIGLYKITSRWGKWRIIYYNLKHSILYSPHPLTAKIEINSNCNLNCVMCLRNKMKRPLKYMSLEQFKTALDNLPSIIEWSPHGYNEPMLHPQFFDFVSEAKNRGINLTLVTNATMLDKKSAEKLLSYKPHQIIVSIDAIGKRYEEIRRGANWKDININIHNLVNLARITDTRIALYSTIWNDNVDQIEKLVDFATSLDVPISISDITWLYETGESTKDNSIRENYSKEYIEGIVNMYDNIPNVSIILGKLEKRSCDLPWYSIYVDVNGNVYPCTDNLESYMGNIFVKSGKEIYNRKTYRQFRFKSYYGLNGVNCRKCQAWAEPKLNEKKRRKLQERSN